MQTFCSILTSDYYPRALTLYKSLIKFNPEAQLQLFITDKNLLKQETPKGIKLVSIEELAAYELVDELYKKYAHIDMDHFRWSMKGVFISYLLENSFERVIYIDCDMFFVNDYNFLFEKLAASSILLTAHRKNTDPLVDESSFISNFTDGIFSAGFIGANKNGLPALKWWANACHFMMGKIIKLGIFDDQKYLDIFPVKFEKVEVLTHRGCNIGAWNYEECKRVAVNKEVLINGIYPIIFIHFDDMMVQGILKGYDKLLLPYWTEYLNILEESGGSMPTFINKLDYHINASLLVRLKWKLLVKTRIKRALYKLAGSI